MYYSRYTLLSDGEKLAPKNLHHLNKALNLSQRLERAYELKEDFREIMQSESHKEAEQCLEEWYSNVKESGIEPMIKAMGTVKRWENKIVNYFDSKITNGFIEGLNNKIKVIKRNGYGIPNFYNFKSPYFNLSAILFLEEIMRVLKSEGIAVITEYAKPDGTSIISNYVENHKEVAITFELLKTVVTKIGFKCEVLDLNEYLNINNDQQILSPVSFEPLKKLLGYYGIEFKNLYTI